MGSKAHDHSVTVMQLMGLIYIFASPKSNSSGQERLTSLRLFKAWDKAKGSNHVDQVHWMDRKGPLWFDAQCYSVCDPNI